MENFEKSEIIVVSNMKKSLAKVKLHTGEDLEISLFEFPNDEYRRRIKEFFLLDHSPGLWFRNLDKWLDGVQDGNLVWFIGEIESEIISGVAVYCSAGNGVADLGHVYTVPEHREKGIQDRMFAEIIKDLPTRGVKVVYLETGYGIPAYFLYQKHGFRDHQKPGFMRKLFSTKEEIDVFYFKPRKVSYSDVKRSDLCPLLHLLSVPEGPICRSYAYGLYKNTPSETRVLEIVDSVERKKCSTTVLRDSENRLMGLCLVSQQTPTETLGHSGVLDLFVHPNYTSHVNRLLMETLSKAKKELEVENILAYIEADNKNLIEASTKNSLVKIAQLPKYFKSEEAFVDVFIFGKEFSR